MVADREDDDDDDDDGDTGELSRQLPRLPGSVVCRRVDWTLLLQPKLHIGLERSGRIHARIHSLIEGRDEGLVGLRGMVVAQFLPMTQPRPAFPERPALTQSLTSKSASRWWS